MSLRFDEGSFRDPAARVFYRGTVYRRLTAPAETAWRDVTCQSGATVPLRRVVEWVASLGGSVIVEFVTRADPMVRHPLSNTSHAHEDYDLAAFEAHLADAFEVHRRLPLASGTRVLYFATCRPL
jgi:hypothetical protein